jgi:hypothetical protein
MDQKEFPDIMLDSDSRDARRISSGDKRDFPSISEHVTAAGCAKDADAQRLRLAAKAAVIVFFMMVSLISTQRNRTTRKLKLKEIRPILWPATNLHRCACQKGNAIPFNERRVISTLGSDLPFAAQDAKDCYAYSA